MPSFDRVCHNVYINPSKGGFPSCNSTRYPWWSESLHLKWWTILLHNECTTHAAKATLFELQYLQQIFLQSLESDRPVSFIKIHPGIIMLLCAWFVWLFVKSRNHWDNAVFMFRFFDATNSDLRCVRTLLRANSEWFPHQPLLWPMQVIAWPKPSVF